MHRLSLAAALMVVGAGGAASAAQKTPAEPVDEKVVEQDPGRFPEWAAQRLKTLRGEAESLGGRLEGKEGRRQERARRDLLEVKERVLWTRGRLSILDQEADPERARKEVREEIDEVSDNLERIKRRAGDKDLD